MVWDSAQDVFKYTVSITPQSKITKRTILSTTAQIFDPLGLISPCVIKAKLIIQQLWQLGVNWDESIPMEIHRAWVDFSNQILSMNNITIPRYFLCTDPCLVELHCFSDASEKAYGCCCYLRSIDNSGKVLVHLICAKSRVAPLKVISLPRLELCGALLLSRLAQTVISALKINFDNVYYYTDSTIVLAWIAMQSNKLQTFVANRVSEIQQSSQDAQWLHVSSENNPADTISRGLAPEAIQSCSLWWNGPSLLHQKEVMIPSSRGIAASDIPDIKNTYLSLLRVQRIRYSSINFPRSPSS